MATLVLATRNPGKVRDLAALLADPDIEVRSLADYPDLPEVVEDGETFAANARKKAVEVAAGTGLTTLADDSGLEVDALEGAPGVFSARYGGPGLSDTERCEHLLRQLAERGVESSPGRFRCVAAVATPDGELHTCEGVWEGLIGGPMRGEEGFGYDPIFEVPDLGRTAAQLTREEKNRLSHRGQALQAVRRLLRQRPELLEG